MRLDLATGAVIQKSFHLGAVGRVARGRTARGGMQEQRHVQGDAARAFLSLLGGEGALLIANGDGLQLMRMTGYGGVAQTVDALIKVSASWTVEALPLENFASADGTLRYELGGIAIVQVPKDHHGSMLGPTERIELIMVALAEV